MRYVRLPLAFVAISNRFRSLRSAQVHTPVIAKADERLPVLGATAFDNATQITWDGDGGFVHSRCPGYWWSVRHDMGRSDVKDRYARTDFTAYF